MAQFPSAEIAQKSYEYRTLGLGYCNIGSVLMHMGIPYDDERAYAICGALTAIMCGESYATSAEMAAILGPYPDYERNAEHMLRVMRNHRRAAYDAPVEEYEGLSIAPQGINAKKCPQDLLTAARDVWDKVIREGGEHGFRNAQTTVIAPTGTIGLVMGADTTGVEPQFSLVQFKTLAGGGSLRIINRGVPNALHRLGYSDSVSKSIEEYVTGTKNLINCPHLSVEKLQSEGFTSDIITKIENSFGDVFDLRSGFSPSILGESFCLNILGMTGEQFSDDFFDILSHIGLTSAQINEANDVVFGKATLEGAPGLKDEHLAVFDCATPCGKYGTRSIDWRAHVLMMASAQSFISGAISKTINMPSNSTISEIRDAYDLSHATMNKACAVYRDGSKLSQPLMNQLVDSTTLAEDEHEEEEVVAQQMVQQVIEQLPIPQEISQPVATNFVHEYIASRKPLPDVRSSSTMKARVGGHTVYLSSSTYDDGRLGEIMITTSKEGAAWRSMLNQFAIAVSIGLQYGVPLDAFVKSFTFQKFEPSGMVTGGSGRVKMSTSIVDYIFRELAIHYIGRNDLAHVTPEDLDKTSISRPEVTDEGIARNQGQRREVQLTLDAIPSNIEDSEAETRRIARERGFTGDICNDCGGSQMVRNGTCLKCNSCGATTGCS
jgi:ribonucleoside-diphosphate reductase alpha chain